jgi:hypothetical protein
LLLRLDTRLSSVILINITGKQPAGRGEREGVG